MTVNPIATHSTQLHRGHTQCTARSASLTTERYPNRRVDQLWSFRTGSVQDTAPSETRAVSIARGSGTRHAAPTLTLCLPAGETPTRETRLGTRDSGNRDTGLAGRDTRQSGVRDVLANVTTACIGHRADPAAAEVTAGAASHAPANRTSYGHVAQLIVTGGLGGGGRSRGYDTCRTKSVRNREHCKQRTDHGHFTRDRMSVHRAVSPILFPAANNRRRCPITT